MIRLCSISDLPENEKKLFTVNGREILVAHTPSAVFAVGGICPHAGGKLIDGRVGNDTITCIDHGIYFDLKTGAIRFDPLNEELLEVIDVQNLPFGPLKTYETVVENGVLYLNE